ncbi:M20 family metallopeptidase [Polyangium aurulentum]|uniref:M20 family metallopeptidase n=1 Tax=Polyangium aurulentum TaxID=2567896 RepID=UPI0010AE1CED|nr:M20 family metallopeptidase [Polyangium aurulentum]UQA61971.1 M20 family metallopeptidase [Polyangium aurulentum]
MTGWIREHLRAREGAALELLEALVEVNSYTHNRAGGTVVGDMLAAELGSIEGMASVRAAPSERFAPHWIASTAAADGSPEGCIAIVGHLDTVFPPGSFEGFRREGPIAHGPGVLDMKGGLVVVLEALCALGREGVLAEIPVRVVIVSDEEIGSPEGRLVIERELAGASAALVFEAGRAHDAVITARKGTGSARVVAKGRAAHAGNAHADGANAIWALCRFVERAQGLTDYARGVTVNVGTISGGQGKNTVPDHAEALLDFRYERREDGEGVLEALARASEETAASVRGTSVVVEGDMGRLPLERLPASVELYREYAACAREAGLGDGEAPLVGGGSDASSTAALGIPSIDGLGPRGTGFHTRDERIEIATLVPKAEALARFLLGRRGGAR